MVDHDETPEAEAAVDPWSALLPGLGYRLVVTDSAARLFRLPLDGTVVAPRRFRPPSRRVLVLAILGAAAAEDAEDVTTTQDLSDRARVLSTHEDVGLAAYDPDRFAERTLFVKAVQLLVSVGALRPTGRDDEEQREGWAHRRDAIGGAYEVRRELLLRLVDPVSLRAVLTGGRDDAPPHEAAARIGLRQRRPAEVGTRPHRPGRGHRGGRADPGLPATLTRTPGDRALLPRPQDRHCQGGRGGRWLRRLAGATVHRPRLPRLAEDLTAVPSRFDQPLDALRRRQARCQVRWREGRAAVPAAVRRRGRRLQRGRWARPALRVAGRGDDRCGRGDQGVVHGVDGELRPGRDADGPRRVVQVPDRSRGGRVRPGQAQGLPGVDAVPYLWCGGEWTAVALPVTDARADEALLSVDGLFAELDTD